MSRNPRATFLKLILSLALVLAFVASVAPQAHAASIVNRASAATSHVTGGCWVLHVQLNGAQPATSKCLVAETDGGGRALTPSIMQSNCQITDVQIFENSNYQGHEICFSGAGAANLTNYTMFDGVVCSPVPPWPCYQQHVTWNDQLTSYKTGNWYGSFYWGTNYGVPQYLFDYGNLFCSYIGGYWNDQISMISIVGYDSGEPARNC